MDQNKLKTALYGTGIFALILISIAALSYANTYANSFSPESGWNTLTISGEGKVTAVPDVAQVSFSVTSEGGTDVSAIQRDTNTKMDDITKYLIEQGIAKEDIRTDAYMVEPRYQSFPCTNGICRPATIVGYTVRQSVAVKIRDIGKAGDILAGVVSRGANGATGPTFVIDDPSKLENEARGKAIEQAKEKARSIGHQSGIRLGKLLSVSDDGKDMPVPYYAEGRGGMAMDSVAQSAPAANIQPGSQDVTVRVTLTYSLR